MKLLSILQHLTLASLAFTFTPYVVENCGDERFQIQYSLGLAYTSLIMPKAETAFANYSPRFKAMFKKVTTAAQVSRVIRSIMYRSFDGPGSKKVTFVCVTPDVSVQEKYSLSYDPWAICNEEKSTSFWRNDNLIWLCPTFLSLPPAPLIGASKPPPSNNNQCPFVFDNRFFGRVDGFSNYQIYDIIRQLVYVYLQDQALNATTIPRGETDWNACIRSRLVDSDGSVSLRDPMNFVYYVARKLYQLLAVLWI